MSAPEITQAVLQALQENSNTFYLINYANADMVGHSGDYLATVKAIQCLDQELFKLYTRVVEQLDGTLYITADHGKAEEMWNVQLGQPRTAHTINKVPFLYINKASFGNTDRLPLEELSDIGPFILQKLQLPIPEEMIKS
jgi:2,3-bisphosphoglycerate-independent phosphoglycerate mutase